MTITKPNLTLILITIIAIMVAVIALSHGCNKPVIADQSNYIDSLRHAIEVNDANYSIVRAQDSTHISVLMQEKDSAQKGWQDAKARVMISGKQLLALNEHYKQARADLDTMQQLIRCDSLSSALDSTAQVVWNAQREVDRLLFINDDLKNAQDTALARCKLAYAQSITSVDKLGSFYDLQFKHDQQELKRSKRGKVVAWCVAAVMTVLMAIKK